MVFTCEIRNCFINVSNIFSSHHDLICFIKVFTLSHSKTFIPDVYQDVYPIIMNIELRNGFTLPKEFEINFDLYPYSNIKAHQTIMRFTNTNGRHGNLGDRIPIIQMNSKRGNRLLTYYHIGTNKNRLVTTKNKFLTLNAKNSISIKQVKEGSDYKYKIYVDGNEEANILNSDPQIFENVRVLTGDFVGNSIPLDGRIENLKIFPGRCEIIHFL